MKEDRDLKCPQIRYHISYDENLTLKDLEDLLYLIRISNNDALQEMGISRIKGNDLQKIQKIEPGSIDLVTTLSVITSTIQIVEFILMVIKFIKQRYQKERKKDLNGTKTDKKLYYRNELNIKNEEETLHFENSATIIVNIHIHNKNDTTKEIEFLNLNK